MSWINDNKFAATLAGVTAVGSIGLFYLSMQKGTLADEAEQQLNSLLQNEKSLMTSAPFPNAENQEEMSNSAESFAQAAVLLQQEFLEYRPESLEDFMPSDFTPKLITYSEKLQKLFKKNQVEYPEGGFFGFGDYARVAPKKLATAELDYQLRASQWLFTELAEVKPEKLINVVRPRMAIELEAEVAKPEPVKRNNRKPRNSRKKSTASIAAPVYDVMPMEISFLCTEAQFTEFYERLANSKEFCFAVRSLRIQNEVGRPPSEDDAKFEDASEPSTSDLSFDNFASDEDTAAPDTEDVKDVKDAEDPEAPAEVEEIEEEEEGPAPGSDSKENTDTTQILKQVLGAEKINVYMKLDLLLFKPESEIGLGKAAGLKNQPVIDTDKQ